VLCCDEKIYLSDGIIREENVQEMLIYVTK